MRVATAIPPARAPEREIRAFLRLLTDICRRFPDLRAWLVEDFARDAKVQANFLGLVETGELGGEDMADAFAELAGELGSWREEKLRMRAELPAQAARPFGGLSWDEMESLVRRYEARTVSLDVFLLVRDWRKAGESAKASPKLMRTGAKPTAPAKWGRISKRSAFKSALSTSAVSANATASAVTARVLQERRFGPAGAGPGRPRRGYWLPHGARQRGGGSRRRDSACRWRDVCRLDHYRRCDQKRLTINGLVYCR